MKIFFKQSVVIIFFLLSACGGTLDSVKRGLSGQKKASTDEFLVEKKDPLILPPQHDKLPLPKSSDFQEEEENTVQSILKTGQNSEIKKSSSMSSLEKKVLEELRKN